MSRVEIPAPGDLVLDDDGFSLNVAANLPVSLTLAGTGTAATHYSALTGGTSTTGGLITDFDGTIIDGSGGRRYVDSGVALDMTISGRTKRLEPISASVEGRVGVLEDTSDRSPLSAYFPAGVTVLTATPTQMLAAIHAGLDWSALTGGTLVIPATVESLVISGPIVPPYNSRMAGPSTARFSEMTGGSHGSSANQWPVLPNAIGVAWIKLANGANGPLVANDYTNAAGKRGPDPRGDGNRYVQRFTARGIVFDHNGANQTGALRAIDLRKAWGMNFEFCHLINPRGLGWSYDNCDDCNSEKLSAVGSTENVANGTGTTTSSSPTITSAGGTWAIGDLIAGTGIPSNTFVSNVVTTTLTLAKTSDGTAQNATASGSVSLSKQTMICTGLLSLTNTTVDSEHIGISMHGAQNGVILDGAFGTRVSGLTGYAIGGYNLQLLDSGGVLGGCKQNQIDLRTEQATKHNVRLSSGAKSNQLDVKAFAPGLFNTPSDSDGGWANVFDDGKGNVVHGTGGRGNAVFGPSNLPIHVFGPNTSMGRNYMSGGDDLAANTVLYKSRPSVAGAPGTVRSSRHMVLPDPFVIAPRDLSGAEGTTLTFSAFNTYHEVAVLPDAATTTVVAYLTIPPGANSLRVQLALVNLNSGVSGNVRTQLGYGDTTEFGGQTPGTDEGSVQLQTVALAASNAETVAGFGSDGGAVGFPGTITCGQQSWIRFKRIGADAADTLAADVGIKGILITPLLLAA